MGCARIAPEQASACTTRSRLDIAVVRVALVLASCFVSPSDSPVFSVCAKPSLFFSVMLRCVVLACAAGAVAAAAPQVINAEFDAAEAGVLSATFPAWDSRARILAQRVSAVEQQLSGFLGSRSAAGHASASLLALQPVDADRVRDGLAVTEAMPAADGLNVNVVERQESAEA